MTTTDETVKLLPCPFCGGQAKFLYTNTGESIVECKSCKCQLNVTFNGAFLWNRRAPITRSQALDELTAEAQRLKLGYETSDEELARELIKEIDSDGCSACFMFDAVKSLPIILKYFATIRQQEK